MADSIEYRCIVSCAKPLEAALKSLDRDLVHFLHQEGFITEEVHDEILNPQSMWTAHQKAGELVTGIRNKVKLSAQSYHTLLEHLQQGGKFYEGIVKILEEEYTRHCNHLTGSHPGSTQLNFAKPLSSAFTRYRKYLKLYYSKHSVAPDDKLSIAPCPQFLRLELIKKDSISSQDAHHASFIGIDSIVQPDFQLILVEGLSGIGKSTLCWELCRKWDTLKSLQCFKIVLLLKLRERHIQNATELNEIFFHRDKKLCQSVVDEVLECEGEGVLLVLDGFDEIPDFIVKEKDSLLMELVSGDCLPLAVRLLTSRPSALHRKKHFPNDYRHVVICGFTDEQKIQYAEKAFDLQPDVFEHFKTFVIFNPTISSLMCIPVNCAIMVRVYKDIRRSRKLMPTTMTQLYTTLVLVLIRRHMIEKKKWDEETSIPDSLENLPGDILTDLKRIGELAHSGGHRQFFFSDKDVGEGFQHLGLLCVTKEMYVSEGAKSSYCFLHLSMQDFMWAWHLSYNPSIVAKSGWRLLICSNLESVGLFLAGILGSSEPFVKDVPHSAQSVVSHLHEAQDQCRHLKDLVSPDFNTPFRSNNSLDLHHFGYVLAHAPIHWELEIRRSSDISKLVNCLRSCKEILGSIPKLIVRDFTPFCSSSELKDLPACVLEKITDFSIEFYIDPCVPHVVSSIAALHNLKMLKLTHMGSFENSHLLCEAIRSLSNLTMLSYTAIEILDSKEVEEFAAVISNGALQYVELKYDPFPSDSNGILSKILSSYTSDFDSSYSSSDGESEDDKRGEGTILRNKLELWRLVKAALACATLIRLSTNIPFLISRSVVACKLEFIDFEYSPNVWCEETLSKCLCCIADMCKMPSMRYLSVSYRGEHYPVPDEFLAKLNESLHVNATFSQLSRFFHISSNYLRETFSKTLLLSPKLVSWSRSISLSDIDLKEEDTKSVQATSPYTDCIFYTGNDFLRSLPGSWEHKYAHFRVGSKCQSCPDLTQMQSSHNVHPLLYKALNIAERVYYDKTRYDIYNFILSAKAKLSKYCSY